MRILAKLVLADLGRAVSIPGFTTNFISDVPHPISRVARMMWLPTDNPPLPTNDSAQSRGSCRVAWAGLLLAVFCIVQPGCVSRRVTLQSDPPGALVLIDGEERGYTPYSMDFTYYGTREIQLVKPGFETLTVMQKIPKPWYQVLPIEFFSDNLWPCRTTDRNSFFYRMQPHTIAPEKELLDRANGLRTESRVGR